MKPHPLLLKGAAIAAISVLMAMALGRIGDLVDERQRRFQEAEQGVIQGQTGPQALYGPWLRSRCTEEWETRSLDGKVETGSGRREFSITRVPRRLEVKANAVMEPRYRGLFKINTYVTRADLDATWDPLRPAPVHAGAKVKCDAPTLMMEVADARGIRRAELRVGTGSDLVAVRPGTGDDKHPSGFSALLPEGSLVGDQPQPVKLVLELAGTRQLAITPLADDNQVQLSSNWPHPSFGGRHAPTSRSVRPDGFDATWQVSSLATNGSTDAGTNTLDVAFIDPVNPYVLSDRAIKYGMLFVGLTFVAVAMVELLQRRRVHPVQYLLVGCAISVFFLLLLSLSEHLSFAVSYAGAATACVALLAFYGRHVLGGWPQGLVFGAGIAGLYGALYALLQMEQTALVIGAVLLFCVLAGVMVATRRLDWYGLAAAATTATSEP